MITQFDFNNENIYQIMDLVNISIFWKNKEGKIIGCNKFMLDLFHIKDRKEMIGKSEYDFLTVAEANRIREIDEAVMKGSSYHGEETAVIDNKERTYFVSKNPLKNPDGSIVGIIGTAMDITAEREATTLKIKLANYQAELKAQDRFSEFISGVMNLAHNYKLDIFNEKLGYKGHNEPIVKIKLSKREEQVLYFLVMGKTPKEIASILSKLVGKSISHSTVSCVISKQLYSKLEASNTGQLIEKANRLHLVPFIPKSLSSFLHKQINEL
ncbi:MAG: PAS domain-containing protein [Neisseriaceae bacterium]